jgi:glycosyltransferase involved in cell wall biosynthesis
MILLVASDTRFYQTPDGKVWTESQNSAAFWERYLDVYEQVLVLARVKEVEVRQLKWIQADGTRIQFYCLPYYIGPWQYLRVYFRLKREIKHAVSICDCAILRAPGTIATLCWKILKKQKKPFNVEVCGDPWESLAPGTVKSIVRPLVRITETLSMQRQCQEANGVAYVTEYTLQRRYPPRAGAMTTHYSSIELTKSSYKEHKPLTHDSKIVKIIHVGSMETKYKAQDVLIKAVHECLKRNVDVHLSLVGDGRCRSEFEQLVKDLQLEDRVTFLGMLPGLNQVVAELDRNDLFVLPSLVEGLPRALIEAMARRLPCIATNVGGIPELLDSDVLIAPQDHIELANKIIEVMQDQEKLEAMVKRNYAKSLEFDPEELQSRRNTFYQDLKQSLISFSRRAQ